MSSTERVLANLSYRQGMKPAEVYRMVQAHMSRVRLYNVLWRLKTSRRVEVWEGRYYRRHIAQDPDC